MFELSAPNIDINVGDNFNLTLLTDTDVIGQNVWLTTYPAELSLVIGNNPQQIQLINGVFAIPLTKTVEYAKKYIHNFEPALEMLDQMYDLGIKAGYAEKGMM